MCFNTTFSLRPRFGLVLGYRHYITQKILLISKVVKSETKIIILLRLSKSVTQTHPAAQLPLAVPPLLVHSLAVKHVPLRTDLYIMGKNFLDLWSISPTFYALLLHVQIPKA
jgi:hypothetical protein